MTPVPAQTASRVEARSADPAPAAARVVAEGKFLTREGRKVFLNGVSYGPFAPNSRAEPFPEDAQLARDFAHIRELGFNTVRLYELPTAAVLREAVANGLWLMAGIPWTDHVDILSRPALRRDAEERVREAARKLGGAPCIVAFLVGNEIEKTLARWMGPLKVRRFLEDLIAIGREEAPGSLFSYATYPSTEYLVPRNADFLAINVYLEDRGAWENYLRRLQNLAGNKPLVITEFGLDAASHGERAQAEVMRWQRESLLRAGASGNVWFSYTDEWFRGGETVRGWSFGLVDRDRAPRLASEIAPTLPAALSPAQPGKDRSDANSAPRVSVIVCTRNGSATLRACLESLGRQSYGSYEVLVIDDGSTDATAEIARAFPFVRCTRQEHAGLSAARNLGMKLARGEILAYTDDDCIADEDWLARLAAGYDDERWVAVGGPNIPPPPRNRVEALVAAAPGAPTHVLLGDEEAEHLPGCNFSVRKAALERIGGFHPDFRTAGDDVDVCWRLREAGGRLRYVPAAMVWHHRRFSVRAYLRQQAGYGRAEALLMKHHPGRFGPLGGARWRGAIYGDGLGLRHPAEGSIFHGPFGFAPFQAIYPQGIAAWWDLFAGVLWIALAVLALALRLPQLAALIAAGAAVAAWLRTEHTSALPAALSVRDRALLWLLCLLQPVVREWARLMGMLKLHARPSVRPSLPEIILPGRPLKWSWRFATDAFWSADGIDRTDWMRHLRALLAERGRRFREDDGWRWFDFEARPRASLPFALSSVTEYHGGRRGLTRIGYGLRLRRLPAILLAVGGVVAMGWLGPPVGTVILVVAGAFVLRLAIAFRALRALAREAARRAGLETLGRGQADLTAEAGHASRLAALEGSCHSA